jgi:hypothetical protein
VPARGPGTETIPQLDASQPLEKLQRPETRNPPLTGAAAPPAGLRHVLANVSGPLAKKSSWARSEK